MPTITTTTTTITADCTATSGYTGSAASLSQVSLATDGIFSDGYQLELATITGDVAAGVTATLTIAV